MIQEHLSGCYDWFLECYIPELKKSRFIHPDFTFHYAKTAFISAWTLVDKKHAFMKMYSMYPIRIHAEIGKEPGMLWYTTFVQQKTNWYKGKHIVKHLNPIDI